MLRPGMFLQDRYEIPEEIGPGGTSDMYKARCRKLNRLVATKVLKEEFSSNESSVSKFKMETQAAAGLSHPNIINVYDVIDKGSLHYIVMELIEGVTLKNCITKRRKLDVKEAVGIPIQVTQEIAAAHERDITHRDIKPQNMIISRDGKVKVADFGIARAATAQTLNSAAMGSVHYISPEQVRGGYSDARNDIYSLGITMYEVLTERLLFEGDNTVTAVLAHLEEPIIRPSHYNPAIPISLESIILKCTEKKPEYRYVNINGLTADLKYVLVNLDENLATMDSGEPDYSKTITISPKELDVINKGQKIYESSVSPGRGRQEAVDDGDVDSKTEKLMTVVGIVIAILIAATLIFVLSKLGGLLSLGSGGKMPTTTTEPVAVTESTSLADMEAYMPDVLNLPEDIAGVKLKDSILVMEISGYEGSEMVEKGYVLRQETPEGAVVSRCSTVNATPSNGTNAVTLAELSLAGLNAEAAKSLLESRQTVVVTSEESNETVERGKVPHYEPGKAKPGETMTLTASSGPAAPLVEVPNITDVADEVAQEMMADYGFIKGEVTEELSDTTPAGTVISQVAVAGTQLAEGSLIDHTPSKRPDYSSKRCVVSISETYSLTNLIRPGADSPSIQVFIRLKQMVNNESVYKGLMQSKIITGQDLLPVSFPSIEGVLGVETEEVEIIDVTSGAMIKSYLIRSFVMEIE